MAAPHGRGCTPLRPRPLKFSHSGAHSQHPMNSKIHSFPCLRHSNFRPGGAGRSNGYATESSWNAQVYGSLANPTTFLRARGFSMWLVSI